MKDHRRAAAGRINRPAMNHPFERSEQPLPFVTLAPASLSKAAQLNRGVEDAPDAGTGLGAGFFLLPAEQGT
jgi:hypothetical protein